MSHLRSFLDHPPADAGAAQWIQHARETLDRLENGDPAAGETA